MSKYGSAIEALKNNNKIAVFMHINPDGDCICSALALYLFLKKLGKDVSCFSQNFDSSVMPRKFNFLPHFYDFNASKPEKSYDLCVAVDVAEAGRLGEPCFRTFMKGKKTLVIDHHLPTQQYSDITIRECESSSTAQILYKILKEFDESTIDAEIATCLYSGLVTDSGCFTFHNTSAETHLVASELLSYGLDASTIARKVMKDVDYDVFKLKNKVLDRAEFFDDKKIAIISFFEKDFKETGTTEKDTEGTINFILDITSVEVAVSISEIAPRSFKVSFRTKTTTDASACARCFGGGGHFHASGCRLFGCYEDIKNKILSAIREMMSYA